MKAHAPLAALFVLAASACGGSPAPPAVDVPGADSSAAPPTEEELVPPAAPCPEGSPDCAAPAS